MVLALQVDPDVIEADGVLASFTNKQAVFREIEEVSV